MRNIIKTLFVAVTVFATLSACESIREQTKTVNGYYDVDSLITETIAVSLGQAGRLSVTKEVSIDGKTEQKSISLDKEALEAELRLFRELDLNEPALLYSYDRSGEQGITIYKLKESESPTGILWLKITESGDVRKLEGVFKENNPVYYTMRQLSMQVKNGKLDRYQMSGTQKMLLKDTIHYSMNGTITN